jgi:hypothetical protein
MKSLSFSAKPRFPVLLAVSAFIVLGLILAYSSTSKAELINQVKVVPAKLYNEDLFEWFNVTFLPQSIEDRELTEILDNHNVTDDAKYHPSRKESVYDVIGPLIAKSGGIGERRFYVAKDAGVKGSGVYANEFMAKDTLIGVFTGVRTTSRDSSTYTWNYQSEPIYKGHELDIGNDAMYAGNMLRFFNDGKKEHLNCKMVAVAWENRWFRVYMVEKDIYPGQELLISYGSGYWKGRDFAP